MISYGYSEVVELRKP